MRGLTKDGPGRGARRRTWAAVTSVATVLGLMASAPAAHADAPTVQLEPVIAYTGDTTDLGPHLSTIVITGTGLPVAPSADIGEETGDSQIVNVHDDGGGVTDGQGNEANSWDAGYGGADCEVTIGESTTTTLVLSVGDQGGSCDLFYRYYVHPGDSLTITLYDPTSGDQVGQVGGTAVAPNGSTPSVDTV